MLLADLVLVFHLLVVVFNVGGLLLIVVGGVARWQWIRGRLWRWLHLALALLVAVEAWIGASCPLTVLENALRGQQSAQSFVGRLMTALIYWDAPPWFFCRDVLGVSARGIRCVAQMAARISGEARSYPSIGAVLQWKMTWNPRQY